MIKHECPLSNLTNQYFTMQGTRDLAVSATKDFPEGTLGHVVHSAVAPVFNIVGNIWSGDIGHHYADPATQALLAQPATDANIENFAQRETAWWQEQSGGPGLVGGSFTAGMREAILKHVRDAA